MDEIIMDEESSVPDEPQQVNTENTRRRARKISELECLKISNSFPLRSSDKCSIQNDFAVIIDTGVHILSFRPNVWNTAGDKQRYSIRRAFIQTPMKFPLEDLPLDYQKLDREKFCLLYLNPKLRPNVDRLETPIRRVKQVDWGYVSSAFHQRCILGVLTNQGCLQLFSYTSNRYKWTLCADISELWKQYCVKTWFSAGENDFSSFMKAYKCMRITTFAWCNRIKLKNENDALLVCVSDSGMLSFWTISADVNVSPELIKTHELGPCIHSCLWYTMTNGEQAFLVSCYTDGTVALNVCTIDRDLRNITFKGDLTLWKEQDYCIAENMKILVNEDGAMLVLSKEQWLLTFSLDNEVTMEHFSFDKRIAGLEIMNDFSVFVTLLNFKSSLVRPFKEGNKESILHSFPTNVRNHRCSGVSFSRNKEFCVFSINLAKFHDHLTFKEPWYLLLCSVTEQLTSESDRLKFEDLLNTVMKKPIHESFDRIENFRIYSQTSDFVFDENRLLSVWNFMKEDDPRVWKNVLQLAYILMSGCKLSKNPEMTFFVEMSLCMYNFQYGNGEARTERSELENQFYLLWLQANYNNLREPLKEHKLFTNIPVVKEGSEPARCDKKCELCSSAFTVHHNTNCVICEKGHKILRCRSSFLPITLEPYNECPCCHAVIIRKSGFCRCVMCDTEL